MYEVLQALGGLKLVTEARKFSVVKRLLHISERYTAFSTAGRQHYERWVSPCEAVLRAAVEAEYRRNGHWVASYEWLQYAADAVNDDTAEVASFRDSGEAHQAALRARYAAHSLEEVETGGTLPAGLSASCPATVRLDLRNHMLRMWYRCPQRRLDVLTAVRDVPPKYHGLANAIYTQLVIAGAINVGAVPFITPVMVRFAKDPSRARRRVAVIGAGFAGLAVARQLRALGVGVTIIEARGRIGGRVHSTAEGGFSHPVDLGAMLITGVLQNPIALLAQQTDAKLHVLDNGCSLFDVNGAAVPRDIDAWAEREYNATLDVTATYRRSHQQCGRARTASLGEAFQTALAHRDRARRHVKADAADCDDTRRLQSKLYDAYVGSTDETTGDAHMRDTRSMLGMREIAMKSAEEDDNALAEYHPSDHELVQRLLWWHVANLEYACAGELAKVSLLHWDQDDPFGFLGEHALVQNGFKTLVDALASGLERNIVRDSPVRRIRYGGDGVEVHSVRGGKEVAERYDAAVVTVPLGVLKAGSVQFEPQLPDYKLSAIRRLGCGALMKVILEFERQFWIKKDMFGNLRETEDTRGEFYIFWNMQPCAGAPILIGMVTEPAASKLEALDDAAIVARAMNVLRRRYPAAPYPLASAVSRWGRDPYARGVYTSITTESSGVDYDLLARPIANLFFAGEHTCRKYPTTCASAVISGLREARNVVEHFGLVESINAVHARTLADALQQTQWQQQSNN